MGERIPNEDNYEPDGHGWYRCKDCKSTIREATVKIPVTYIDCSGSDVDLRTVKYCPKCDKKPSPVGEPVKKSFMDH